MWINLPTRSSSDLNSAADINTLMENIRVLAGNGEDVPDTDIQSLNTAITSISNQLSIGRIYAWVNFNGTTSPPTVRGSSNVASVVKVATGRYKISFTNSMPDANYAVVVSNANATECTEFYLCGACASSKDYCYVGTFDVGASFIDVAYIHVVVVR